ncbi:hypothetical protein C8Q75DRAFT_731851 [Abortiporus biennis]|nr:hypothetical protein C8Q75DRAFT_731851 [Abortiporus biennis]
MSSDSSTAVDSSNLQSPEIQIHIIDYLHLSGIVILYYDYLLTFQDEVRYMWFQPLSSTWLFFLNRYFSIFADIALTIGTFATYTSIEEGMRWYSTASFVITLIGQIIASIILLLRTWALYNRSWNIIISTTSFATGLAVLVIWSTSNESSDNRTISDGCINTPPNASRPRMFMHNDYGVGIAGAWEAHIVYNLMIFATVVFKTYRDREQFREAKLSRFGSLLDLILRDGAIYFAVMACANIANTVTFYVGIPGRLSRLASSISVTLVSRMMLNLRKQATPDFTDQLDDPNMSSIEFEGRTNIHNATVEISQSTSPSREVLQFSFSGSNEQTPSSGNISCEIHEGCVLGTIVIIICVMYNLEMEYQSSFSPLHGVLQPEDALYQSILFFYAQFYPENDLSQLLQAKSIEKNPGTSVRHHMPAGFNVTLENDATTTLGQIYLHLAGIVILYYDYLVTFSDEFNYMWFQGKRIPWLFFINRYFSILVDLSLGAAQLITYNSIEIMEDLGFHPGHLIRSSCFLHNIAGAWDALMAFDIMIFITIVVKTYTQRDVFRREGGRLKNLLQLVFRDGVIYFIVMAVANTANMVTFYTLPVCPSSFPQIIRFY